MVSKLFSDLLHHSLCWTADIQITFTEMLLHSSQVLHCLLTARTSLPHHFPNCIITLNTLPLTELTHYPAFLIRLHFIALLYLPDGWIYSFVKLLPQPPKPFSPKQGKTPPYTHTQAHTSTPLCQTGVLVHASKTNTFAKSCFAANLQAHFSHDAYR